ncbi:hypothetical protein LTS18_010947, partial [Coniosporium uncinatum]
ERYTSSNHNSVARTYNISIKANSAKLMPLRDLRTNDLIPELPVRKGDEAAAFGKDVMS